MATIMFNGKSYSSLEEMPPNDRQAYEEMMSIFVDANGNGIPDFLEGDIVQNVMTAVTSNIHFNGQVYDGMNELPVDVREKIQGAFEKMTELGIVTKTDSPVVIGFNSDQASKDPQIQPRHLFHVNFPLLLKKIRDRMLCRGSWLGLHCSSALCWPPLQYFILWGIHEADLDLYPYCWCDLCSDGAYSRYIHPANRFGDLYDRASCKRARLCIRVQGNWVFSGCNLRAFNASERYST
jgi:hypothetical protein